jgi:predicted nucleotidyltransferase component of viral defense system
MSKIIVKYEERILGSLAGKADNFYLVGGTALSLFYFHHRESLDLDFFTHNFKKREIEDLMNFVSVKMKKKVELVSSCFGKGKLKVMVYKVALGNKESLKIDFVEDPYKLLKPLKVVNKVNILSLEDIYFKKIQAITGIQPAIDLTCRKFFKGGRQEAKDFYDLYCLSSIFMRLSDFCFKYGNQLMREAMVRWFRSYDRLKMKSELPDLVITKRYDYIEMERHFKKEIDAIIEEEVEFI